MYQKLSCMTVFAISAQNVPEWRLINLHVEPAIFFTAALIKRESCDFNWMISPLCRNVANFLHPILPASFWRDATSRWALLPAEYAIGIKYLTLWYWKNLCELIELWSHSLNSQCQNNQRDHCRYLLETT